MIHIFYLVQLIRNQFYQTRIWCVFTCKVGLIILSAINNNVSTPENWENYFKKILGFELVARWDERDSIWLFYVNNPDFFFTFRIRNFDMRKVWFCDEQYNFHQRIIPWEIGGWRNSQESQILDGNPRLGWPIPHSKVKNKKVKPVFSFTGLIFYV